MKKYPTLFPTYCKNPEQIGNYYLRTHSNSQTKKSVIEKMITKYSINGKIILVQ